MKEYLKKRILFYFGTLVFFIATVFASWTYYISLTVDIPYVTAGKFLLRNWVLSGGRFFFSVYDPWSQYSVTAKMTGDSCTNNTDAEMVPVHLYFSSLKDALGRFEPVIENQKNVVSRFPFYYEVSNERLTLLRETMKLDQVVAAAHDEFDELVRLRNWTRSRFRRIDYQAKTSDFDALAIFKNIRINTDNRESVPSDIRPCDIFPRLYIQVLLSMGFQARLCQVSHNGLGHHGLTEVWSNQFNKWVTMDVDLNLHYLKDDIPQNLVEVQRAAQKNDRDLKIVQEIVDPPYQPVADLDWMFRYHRFINIADMRNDWISNHYFPGHPRQSDQSFLAWFAGKPVPYIFYFKPAINKMEDFYWSLNRTQLFVDTSKREENGHLVPFVFRTITPNFSHFVIIVDDQVYMQNECSFIWKLHKGANQFEVQAVNSFGRNGIKSKVSVVL